MTSYGIIEFYMPLRIFFYFSENKSIFKPSFLWPQYDTLSISNSKWEVDFAAFPLGLVIHHRNRNVLSGTKGIKSTIKDFFPVTSPSGDKYLFSVKTNTKPKTKQNG